MIVRLKGVKRVRAKGRVYYYHRRTMTRLPGEPGGVEFIERINELEGCGNVTARPGTLGSLIQAYRASPEYARLALRSRDIYQRVFDYLQPLDGMPLAELTPPTLYALRDKTAKVRTAWFANYTVQVLRLLFAWSVRRGICRENPAVAVEKIAKPRDAPTKNRPWRREELDAALAEAPPPLRAAIALAAFVGLRESDVAAAVWRAYDGQAFEGRQHKTGRPIWVPAHYRLREILDATPRVSPLIVIGPQGRPYSAEVLRTRFFELVRRLRTEGKIGEGLSFHGLRHTLGTYLAEAGLDLATIASILGHATTDMAAHYSRHADRRQLATAAIERLEEHDRNRRGKPNGKLADKSLI